MPRFKNPEEAGLSRPLQYMLDAPQPATVGDEIHCSPTQPCCGQIIIIYVIEPNSLLPGKGYYWHQDQGDGYRVYEITISPVANELIRQIIVEANNLSENGEPLYEEGYGKDDIEVSVMPMAEAS